MNNKPPYFAEAGGNVPILEKSDGTYIPGSDKVIEYALETSGGIELTPQDEKAKQEQQEYIKKFDNGDLVMYMVRALFQGGEEHTHKLTAELEKMEEELAKNTDGNKFFNNNKEITLVDVILAPVLVRIVYALEDKVSTVAEISLDKYPKIAAYVIDITTHPKLGIHAAPEIGFVNYVLSRIQDSHLKLPYPIDLTPLKDSQNLKTLYILNGHTAKPRTNKNYIRLYGHPLCPFVERALLAFRAKQVKHQFCGVDLTEKNKWHKDINGGLVPFIELPDGKFVIESTGVAEWVQDFSSDGVNLYPGDQLNKDRIKEAVESLFKIVINIILSVFKKEERVGDGPKHYIEAFNHLNEELEKSQTKYFLHQDHETMADLMTFPFVHRALLVKGTSLKEKYYDQLDFTKLEKLTDWYDTIYNKYKDVTALQEDFKEHLEKNIEADGPKVQLYYPLPSES